MTILLKDTCASQVALIMLNWALVQCKMSHVHADVVGHVLTEHSADIMTVPTADVLYWICCTYLDMNCKDDVEAWIWSWIERCIRVTLEVRSRL
jgi:hypothetical protein